MQLVKYTVCPKCGNLSDGHPECEGCSIAIGKGHIEESRQIFRDKLLCSACIDKWTGMELKIGHTLTWDEYKNPSPTLLIQIDQERLILNGGSYGRS